MGTGLTSIILTWIIWSSTWGYQTAIEWRTGMKKNRIKTLKTGTPATQKWSGSFYQNTMKIHHATTCILCVAEQIKSRKDQIRSTFLNLRPGSFWRIPPWIIKCYIYYSLEVISNNERWFFLVKMPFTKKRSDLRSSRTISKHLNFFTAFSFEENYTVESTAGTDTTVFSLPNPK